MASEARPALSSAIVWRFKAATAVALLGWAVLAFVTPWLPDGTAVGRGLVMAAVAVVCVLYADLLVRALRTRRAPGSDRPGFTTVRGVLALLSSPVAALAAWVHILAFDLAVAAHLHGEALRLGVPHPVMLPIYALTLMFGPLGYLAFLALASFY